MNNENKIDTKSLKMTNGYLKQQEMLFPVREKNMWMKVVTFRFEVVVCVPVLVLIILLQPNINLTIMFIFVTKLPFIAL